MRASVLESRRKFNRGLKASALRAYGHICAICANPNPVVLTVDHVTDRYGTGSQHIKDIKPTTFYQWLKNENYPDGFQVLCFNCNWYKAHKDDKIWNPQTYAQEYRLRIRCNCFSAYGEACVICGETERVVLGVDHINGNGAEHRRAIGRAKKDIYGWLHKNDYPEGFQTLCMNCNWAKGFVRETL